jgi:hypothetical protein
MNFEKRKFSSFGLIAAAIMLFVSLACSSSSGGENKPVVNPLNSANNSSSANNSTATDDTKTAAPKDIAGEYSVTGSNENGAGNYRGDLTVTRRDDVYQFSWDTAGKKYDGVGVQNGNHVAVAFTEGTNGKGCGVVLYKINADGSLDGRAGYWGVNQSETEEATRTGGTDLAGGYDVTGTNPDGKDYKGKLKISPEGSGYKFEWNTPALVSGFGVKQGNFVAAGLGGKQCGFVSYEIKPDGSLDGKWGGAASTTFGTETAKKK